MIPEYLRNQRKQLLDVISLFLGRFTVRRLFVNHLDEEHLEDS
jgi:uncharacterized membrane protein